MAIGLKNAGSIAANVSCMVEFAIVESCKHFPPFLAWYNILIYPTRYRPGAM
jgi:hypothetical protein